MLLADSRVAGDMVALFSGPYRDALPVHGCRLTSCYCVTVIRSWKTNVQCLLVPSAYRLPGRGGDCLWRLSLTELRYFHKQMYVGEGSHVHYLLAAAPLIFVFFVLCSQAAGFRVIYLEFVCGSV